jgi:hypothetical protein
VKPEYDSWWWPWWANGPDGVFVTTHSMAQRAAQLHAMMPCDVSDEVARSWAFGDIRETQLD